MVDLNLGGAGVDQSLGIPAVAGFGSGLEQGTVVDLGSKRVDSNLVGTAAG